MVKHTILFELQNRRYYNEATGGRYVPRAILMDLEPGTMVRRLLAQVITNEVSIRPTRLPACDGEDHTPNFERFVLGYIDADFSDHSRI